MSINSFSGFFNKISYDGDLQSNNWLSKAENAAQALRAPGHWVAAELWYGKKYLVFYHQTSNAFVKLKEDDNVAGVMRKVIRVVAGMFLGIPGQILALFLMATAYCCSEEIRLKRRVSVRDLTDEESQKLKELIDARLKLEEKRQGEPITCSILCSICYMLCCLVCKK